VDITVKAASYGSLVSIDEDVTDGPAMLVPELIRVGAVW
jgi:hypothetical protein